MKSKEFQDSLERLRLKLLKSQIDLTSDMEIKARAIDSIIPFKKEIQYLFKIYVISGGIPAIINRYLQNRFEDEKETIESTLSEIFVRDVLGDLARLQRQETVIRDILKGILEKYGSRYSFSKLSNTVGRTHVEVKYRANVDRRDVRRISDIQEYILLSKDDIELGKNVLIAPMDLFLSLLPVSERNI